MIGQPGAVEDYIITAYIVPENKIFYTAPGQTHLRLNLSQVEGVSPAQPVERVDHGYLRPQTDQPRGKPASYEAGASRYQHLLIFIKCLVSHPKWGSQNLHISGK